MHFTVYTQHVDLCKIDKTNGNVASVTIYGWNEDTTGVARFINRTFFDTNRRAVSASNERTGAHKKEVLIAYNENGLISNEKYYTQEDKDTTHKSYSYDAEGRLVRKATQRDSESQPHFVIEYTYSAKRIIEEKFYANRAFCAFKETYLNNKGKDSLILNKDSAGKVLNRTNYYYSDGDRQELMEYRNANDTTIQSYCKTYHESDTVFVDSCFSAEGVLKDNARLVFYEFDELYYMKFDVMNDELHDESYYKYVFDDRGNWIEQIAYMHGNLWFIKEREIIYFD
jgi:YD repeat-containing protein